LWQEVRGKKIGNVRFHRQYSVGPYILDFFCPAFRLAIELDGEQHKDLKEYDAEREFFLKGQDIITIRFWNREVVDDIESILQKIKDNCK